ncbi:hypothetical protein XA68_11483 [Ophiocordyceps unilateralis]|uniref:Glutathionylspermidine synthase pre-ATP-grasp-like domain-containing protein n=1 Tax=Ophiocordyceps unilateralis TaxID=268505 RepID=A0A2A9PF25_OPHUN|nr:hypothetical protein XA68_11483 [Ophiocordyceps unilateralis]
MAVEQITKSRVDGRFYDRHGDHIGVIFKLYPYEFMVEEEFGEACFRDIVNIGLCDAAGRSIGGTVWIEQPLFERDPRSKWLLPTYLEREAPALMTSYARKPIYSREGLGIRLQQEGRVIQEQGMNSGIRKRGFHPPGAGLYA